MERDEEGKDKAPEVIKEEINDKSAAGTTFDNLLALGQLEGVAAGLPVSEAGPGHKFGVPELPIPKHANLKYRYDPVVTQVTGLLMKDGKLSAAQRVGSSVSLWLSYVMPVSADQA